MKYLKTEGEYNAIVVSHASNGLFESNNGTPGIRLVLEVNDGPNAGERVSWTGWLSEKAFERTVKTLDDAFGFSGNFEELVEMPNLFMEQQCSIVTEMEMDDRDASKEHCRVKWLDPMGGRRGNAPTLEKNAASALAKRLTGRAQALLKSASMGGSAPARPAPAGSDY
jgi:hypothetical protein